MKTNVAQNSSPANHKHSVNSSWDKYYPELERLLGRPAYETYREFTKVVDRQTASTVISDPEMAQHCGCHRNTIRRHKKLLMAKGAAGITPRHTQRLGRRWRVSDRLTLIPVEQILLRLKNGGTLPPQMVGQVLRGQIKKQATTNLPPTPQGGAPAAGAPSPSAAAAGGAIDPPLPAKPEPSPAEKAALEELRIARAARQERKRQRLEQRQHHRQRRREKTSAQKAADQVMTALGISPALRATRSAIEQSAVRWMAEHQGTAEEAADKLLELWREYDQWRPRMEYPCGMLTWFGECRWREGLPKQVLREMARIRDAGQCSNPPDYREPEPVPQWQRIAEHLQSAAEALERSPLACQAIVAQLRALSGFDAEKTLTGLEETLTGLEEKLFAVLMAAAPEDLLDEFQSKAAAELAPYRSRMSAKQMAEVKQQYVTKSLLKHYQLPRLSLLYMASPEVCQ